MVKVLQLHVGKWKYFCLLINQKRFGDANRCI